MRFRAGLPRHQVHRGALLPNQSRYGPETRFHGLLAPSISHEGYSKPSYSYWDDYFALSAWRNCDTWRLNSVTRGSPLTPKRTAGSLPRTSPAPSA